MRPQLGSVFVWHVVAFGSACLLGIASAVWTYHRRDQYAAPAFLSFLTVTVAWNATVLLRIVGPLSLAWELHLLEQFFQVLMTLVWFYFTAVYAGYRGVITRPAVAYPLGVISAAMLAVESFPPVAAATNTDPRTRTDPFTFVTWTDTALSGLVEVLAVAAFAAGSGLILYKLLTANYVRVWQIGLVFVATSGAILVEVVESSIPYAVSGVDYPALAVTGVGVSYVVGLYRYSLFGYTPVDMSDVIDGITAPVVVMNPEQRIVDFNAPAAATFDGLETGRGADAALPDVVVDAVPVADPATTQTEVTVAGDDGDRIYRLYTASLDSFGDSRGLAVTVRDLTTRRRQRENLDLLTQILSRALRHNIRNQVDVVKAHSQELADRLDGDARDRAVDAAAAADELRSVSAKTRVMKEIVAHRGQTATVDLAAVVDDVVAAHETAYPETSFQTTCPPSCVTTVTPDIEHALDNLVENAAEHTPGDDATVEVSLVRSADGVEITVEDDGPGIPENELTVLERGSEEVLDHGSGIGLWIVTMVVEEINGTIQYDTDGSGTTITLSIEA
jgi:signal transduction histidine kinase